MHPHPNKDNYAYNVIHKHNCIVSTAATKYTLIGFTVIIFLFSMIGETVAYQYLQVDAI
jgi:hypothetical protein